MKEILKLNNIEKEYGIRGFKSKVLNGIDLNVNEGDFIAIMGPSGAGKTTLLNLMSTLDQPSKGDIFLDGIDLASVKNKELARRIYELIKDKKEIQVGDGCFVVDVCDRFETKKDDRARFRIERIVKEKRFYECENKELLSMVKELLSHSEVLPLK